MAKYGPKLKQLIKDERVTISLVILIDKKEPYHFLGTSNGNVYAFPLLFDESSPILNIFHINTGKFPINYIGFMRKQLIISTDKSQLVILRMQDFFDKFKVGGGSSQKPGSKEKPAPSQAGNLNPLLGMQQQAEGEGEVDIVVHDLAKIKLLDKMINAPVKRVMKIHALQSVLDDAALGELNKDTSAYLKSVFCLVLANNAVCLYSCKTSSIASELKGNTQSIQGIFCHPLLDYIIIMTSDTKLHFWSITSGRYVKSDKYANYGQIFSLDRIVEERTGNVSNYNNYNVFRELRQSSISRVYSFLEFNNRHITDQVNYHRESSKKFRSNQHLYEFVGKWPSFSNFSARCTIDRLSPLSPLGYLKDKKLPAGDAEGEVNLLNLILERLQ